MKNGQFYTGVVGAGIGFVGGFGGNVVYQLADNNWDSSKINWKNAWISGGTGALGGFLLTSGLGLSYVGVFSVGAGTNVLNYALTEDCKTTEGYGWAALSGGLGGWLGGKAPNPYTFIKPSPFRQDVKLMLEMSGAKNFLTNFGAGFLGSTSPPRVVSGPKR
jgi:hypothetical protein